MRHLSPKGAEASEGAVGASQVTQRCSQALIQGRKPHTLPSSINYALKLPLASHTGECLSFVFERMFSGRSAPRHKSQLATIRTARLIVRAKCSRTSRLVQHGRSPDPISNQLGFENVSRGGRIGLSVQSPDRWSAKAMRRSKQPTEAR
jgi:hypothetical protein